jgi:pyruvate formate lyase activating enzyme
MPIGGLQKNSLIDYPGKISSVIFLSGCNFDCPYCHNPQLARGHLSLPAELNAPEICRFLKHRRGFLDGVVISGGEPTLDDHLVDFCLRIKQLGYPIKLDTNGSRPRILKQLIAEGLIDYIAMDLKTDPILYGAYIKPHCSPDPILSSIRLIMQSGIEYEFRTTCVKPIITPQTIENITDLIQGARLYVLQRFKHHQVLHPEFFRNNDYAYSDEELMQLKGIAEQSVANCIIR